MKKEIKREYSNGEITIVWEPSKCTHSGICVHELPNVYDPEARPWVKIENASTKELEKQIADCPSAALTYFKNDKKPAAKQKEPEAATKVVVINNGPLIVMGTIELTDQNGKEETKLKRTSFCRCGASKNKPYCDGEHKVIGFKG